MHALIIENEPIFDALTDEFPDVAAAMTRPRWNYADALKAADNAIINQPQYLPKKTTAKRPAKKAAAKKAAK